MDINHNNAKTSQQLHPDNDQELKVLDDEDVTNKPQENNPTQTNNNAISLEFPTQNKSQKMTSIAFQGVATLANKLPTGTLLVYQMLAPTFTNQGECTQVNRVLTWVLIGLCVLFIVVLSFTDSIKDANGNVAYGFVTKNGLWMIDYKVKLPPELAATYRLNPLDFLHALMSVLVFIGIAMLDNNTVKCFAPKPSNDVKQLIKALPLGIGVFCSLLFLWFPTDRNGIGFPS